MAQNPFLEEIKEETNPFLDSPKAVAKSKNPFLEEVKPVKENPFLSETTTSVKEPVSPEVLKAFEQSKKKTKKEPEYISKVKQGFTKGVESILPPPLNTVFREGMPEGGKAEGVYKTGETADLPPEFKRTAEQIKESLSKAGLVEEEPADPYPMEDPVRLALLFGIPAMAGKSLVAKMASGVGFNVGYETLDKLLTEGRLPTKGEYAVSGVAGLLPAGADIAFRNLRKALPQVVRFGSNTIAKLRNETGPQAINRIFSKAQKQGISVNRVINEELMELGEGAKEFNDMWENTVRQSMEGVEGVEGYKAARGFAPSSRETTIGEVFEGRRIIGEPEKGLIESGVEFQAPVVREGYVGSPFQTPETRETIRQGLIEESSPFVRSEPSPDILRKAESVPITEATAAKGTKPKPSFLGKSVPRTKSEYVSTLNAPLNLKRIETTEGAKELLGEGSKAFGRKPTRTFASVIEEAHSTPAWTVKDVNKIKDPMSLTDAQKLKMREALVADAERLEILKQDPNIPKEVFDEQKIDFLTAIGKVQETHGETGRTLGQLNIVAKAVEFGADNRIFTKEMVDAARANLSKRAGRMRTGIDPEDIKDLVKVGGYYIEGGVRDFAKWSEKMVADFGESVRPHLKKIYQQSRTLVGATARNIKLKDEEGILIDITKGMAKDKLYNEKVKAFNALLKTEKGKEWILNKADIIFDAKSPYEVHEAINAALTSPIKKVQNAVEAAIVNGFLSMPLTWAGVHLSQSIYTLERPLAQRPIAAAVDSFLSLVRGTPRTRFLSDSIIEFQSMKDAMPEAARYVAQSFKSQRQVFTEDVLGRQFYPRASFGNWRPGGLPVSKAVEKVVHFPGGSMIGSGDDGVKVLNFRASLHVQAHQKALSQKLSGEDYINRVAELLDNPTADMLEKASKESFDKAFQRELSIPAMYFGKGIHYFPIVGKVVQPFITVLDSGLKAVYERSPLMIPEIGYKILTGKMTQGEFADAASKMIIGGILAGGAYTLADRKMITGGPPLNKKDREVWYAKDYKPYHFYLPNGWGFSYAKAEPMASIIGAVADFFTIRDYADKENGAITIAAHAFARNVLNKTWMEGLSNFFNGIQDPEKSAKSLRRQASGALVPQISYGLARVVDPVLREPRNLVESFMVRIPWLSKNVPAIRDIWGLPVMDLRNGFAKMLDTLAINKLNNDPATQEVLRLHARITSPSDLIGKIPMTQEEYEYLLEKKGQKSHELVTRYINNRFSYKGKRFKDLSDLEKREAIEGIDRVVGEEARKMIEVKVYKRLRKEGYSNKQYRRIKKGREDLPEELREQGR